MTNIALYVNRGKSFFRRTNLTTAVQSHPLRQKHYLTFSAGSEFPVSHEKPRLNFFQWLLLRPGLVIFFGTIVTGVSAFLWWSQDTVPISGRKRSIFIPQKLELLLGESTFESIKEDPKTQIVTRGPSVKRVHKILKRLLNCCNMPELKQLDWEVVVIQDNSTINAMVAPGGKVIFFTGMEQIASTEQMLAAVLSHEIGHVVARHSAESLGNVVFLTVMKVLLFWTLGFKIPNFGEDLLWNLPNSRRQEAEADYIGILLMIRAGYDPYQAVKLWEKMHQYELENNGYDLDLSMLSTHPASKQRMANIKAAIPVLLDHDRKSLEEIDLRDALQINSK